MDSILVRGGAELNGTIPISGAKNACLALMPAALLSDEPLTLTNAPRLSDIRTMTVLLESLGCEVARLQAGRVLVVGTERISNHTADYDIVRKMRASILVLGPMLARDGHAVVSLPGGCAIGARPVDLHLKGLEALGATLDLRDGYVHAEARGGLKGAGFEFPIVSVGGTENLLMAATLAKGTTVLKNAAREPEIVDLAECLRRMGARIEGDGTVLGFFGAASTMRFVRASMLEVINQDYIRTARAKGLKERTITIAHAMRNALIPVVTIVALQIPAVFGGAVITEQIFGIPGIGGLLISSIRFGDTPVVMAITFGISILVVLFNILADVLYAILDPRIKLS